MRSVLLSLLLAACAPDVSSMRDCGDGVFLESASASCVDAVMRVATARRIVEATGVVVPRVDIIFAEGATFKTLGGEADGHYGGAWLMTDVLGGSLTHEFIHAARGVGHTAWLEAGFIGLDNFGTFTATDRLSMREDLCDAGRPTAAQLATLRDAGLPIDAWLHRLQNAQTAHGCY